MNKPSYYNYGHYTNDNYGTHTMRFDDAHGNHYWFSYDTLVAFRINGEFHISRNYWGTTTGKHLNWINGDHDIREDRDTFEANLKRLSA